MWLKNTIQQADGIDIEWNDQGSFLSDYLMPNLQ